MLSELSADQLRFVVARQEAPTDKEAAEAIGLSPRRVTFWKSEQRAPIDEAVRLMAHDGLIMARTLRRRALAKAMAVKVRGLDLDDDRLRQHVATEIVEWELGKATQRQDVRGSVRFVIDD